MLLSVPETGKGANARYAGVVVTLDSQTFLLLSVQCNNAQTAKSGQGTDRVNEPIQWALAQHNIISRRAAKGGRGQAHA